MRSEFKLQKLSLLLILSLSTLSGCNAAFNLPESASSPTVVNEQAQESGAESSNSSASSTNLLATQETTELEKKWDEFLTALSTNIIYESEKNFKAVQTKAKELKSLADEKDYDTEESPLQGLRDFLYIVVLYNSFDDRFSDFNDSGSFNNDLVANGLGISDLEIGDPITLLSDETNKQSTAKQVVDKLNGKYRSLLVSSLATPSPSVSRFPTPSIADARSEDNEKSSFIQFLTVVISLSLTLGSFIALNKRLNVFPALNNYLFLPLKLQESESPTVNSNLLREVDPIKARISQHGYQIQEHDRKILILEQKIQMLEIHQQIKTFPVPIQSRPISDSLPQEPQTEKTSAVLEETPVIPPYVGTPIVLPVVFHLKLETSQNTYKQILSQSTPVEDKNLASRRMGSGETPLFVSTKSRQSHLGIYQDPSGQIFLLPTKSKTNHEKLSSYFNLLEGSPKDGEVEVVQPAIVIANGQGWELYQKGIVSFNL